MANPARDEVFTTVKNTSGKKKYFGFLTPKGLTLDADEVRAIPGDLFAELTSRFDPGMRRLQAFLASKRAGNIEILSRPSPTLYDPVSDKSFNLAVNDEALLLVQATYDSSDDADPINVDS